MHKLAVGDIFFIHSINGTLAYEVDTINTVLPDETESLKIVEGEDLVTLITCTPYMINTHRLLVSGHRVAYEAVQEIVDKPQEADSSKVLKTQDEYNNIYLIAVLASILLLICIILYRRRRIKEGDQNEK